MENGKKILIIRFSSFGDVVQSLSAVTALTQKFPNADIHWLVRKEFADILYAEPRIHKVWSFDRKKGLSGLIRLAFSLSSQNYTVIYDAHNNLRSKIVSFVIRIFARNNLLLRRPKSRIKRLLLFKFGLNKFPSPFKGVTSYLAPLIPLGIDTNPIMHQDWKFTDQVKKKVDALIPDYTHNIIIVPSAAHAMKRWPIDHWKKLIKLLPTLKFTILGGPTDTFCEEIAQEDKMRVQNLAGQLSLIESCYAISQGYYIVSADTGLLHVADLFGKPAIALIGPSAFGFPSGDQVTTITLPMNCRPCSKDGSGHCKNTLYQRCMVEITPEMVVAAIHEK